VIGGSGLVDKTINGTAGGARGVRVISLADGFLAGSEARHWVDKTTDGTVGGTFRLIPLADRLFITSETRHWDKVQNRRLGTLEKN